jgi:hypothetical protein
VAESEYDDHASFPEVLNGLQPPSVSGRKWIVTMIVSPEVGEGRWTDGY